MWNAAFAASAPGSTTTQRRLPLQSRCPAFRSLAWQCPSTRRAWHCLSGRRPFTCWKHVVSQNEKNFISLFFSEGDWTYFFLFFKFIFESFSSGFRTGRKFHMWKSVYLAICCQFVCICIRFWHLYLYCMLRAYILSQLYIRTRTLFGH